MTDEKRIDLSHTTKGHTLVHLRGFHGDDGENEGVLSVITELDPSPHYPECGRVIVGSPTQSPLIPEYIPDLGGFCCGPDAADLLGDELKRAAATARAAVQPADAAPGAEASTQDPAQTEQPGCELCGDNAGPQHLHARCHMTAPLRAEIEGGVLTLYCYVPTCNRVVTRMRVAGVPPHGREHDGSAIGNCTSNECAIRGRCTYPTACRRTDLGNSGAR